MMKKYILSLIAFFSLCASLQANNYFKVRLADGSNLTIPFSSNPEVTYPTVGTISIASIDGKKSYEFDDTIIFTYEKDSETGILGVAADTQMKDGIVIVSGLKSGESVCVSSLSGVVLLRVNADSRGIAIVNTEGIKREVLVVKTTNSSFKIRK